MLPAAEVMAVFEVTDEWVCDANKGRAQAKSTTLTPILVRSDYVLIEDPCTNGQDNSWCQPAGCAEWRLLSRHQVRSQGAMARQFHYFFAHEQGRRRRRAAVLT